MIKRMMSILCMVALVCCTSNNTKMQDENAAPKNESNVNEPLPQNYAGCYQMIISRDTAYLNLTSTGTNYTGDLWYKRYEKDSNKGVVNLRHTDGHLSGWYRFESEGIASVREIKLQMVGENLAEGYGEVAVYGDTVKYKYPETLEYETQNPFVKINCID